MKRYTFKKFKNDQYCIITDATPYLKVNKKILVYFSKIFRISKKKLKTK